MDLLPSFSSGSRPVACARTVRVRLPSVLAWVLVVSLGQVLSPCGTAQAATPAATRLTPSQIVFFDANPQISSDWDHAAGAPRSLRGFAEAVAGDTVMAAWLFLDGLRGVFRIENVGRQLEFSRIHKDELGYEHVRFRQMHAGIPVAGSGAGVHVDAGRRIYQVDSDLLPDLSISTVPDVSADDALRTAAAKMAGRTDVKVSERPGLVILPFGAFKAYLAWRLAFSCSGPGRARSYGFDVDAHSGRILARRDDVRAIADPTTNGALVDITGTRVASEDGAAVTVKGWHDTTNAAWYLYNRDLAWSIRNYWKTAWAMPNYVDKETHAHRTTSVDWGSTDPSEISAAFNLGKMQEFCKKILGRNSMDDAGKLAIVNVHYSTNGTPQDDAFYSPTSQQIFVGDGDGVNSYSSAITDTVGHEYGHAINTFSSEPMYEFESGALDESWADIFGVALEFYAQPDGRSLYPGTAAGRSDWLFGEDGYSHSYRPAMRDLRNPRSTVTLRAGDQLPSRYHGTLWKDVDFIRDRGAVHYNGAPHSFLYYLVSEGGQGENDGLPYNITGIGWKDAVRVAYRANTSYLLTSSWSYMKARTAWISAATDLQGTRDWVSTVKRAFDAIGVTEVPMVCSQGFEQDTLPTGWTTGGDATWSVTTTCVQGTRSVTAGKMAVSNSSYLETTMSPTATTLLTFAWMTSSSPGADRMTLTVDGTTAGQFSGACSWSTFGVTLSAGTHTLRWTYAKTDPDPEGLDTVWIDAVNLRPLVAPTAPVSLTAVVTGLDDVVLSWSDDVQDEQGFRVERKTGADGTYRQVASVGEDVRQCVDSGLRLSTIYCYRVFAYNQVGDSVPSNEVGVTTPGPGPGSGRCFIATAAWGSKLDSHVSSLRRFRDRCLLTHPLGRAFVAAYYENSPPVARAIRRSELLRGVTRWLLTPVVCVARSVDETIGDALGSSPPRSNPAGNR